MVLKLILVYVILLIFSAIILIFIDKELNIKYVYNNPILMPSKAPNVRIGSHLILSIHFVPHKGYQEIQFCSQLVVPKGLSSTSLESIFLAMV